jgi:hypothetical protein
MSRHGFFKVLTDPTSAQEELADLIGYDLYDWLNVGVAGYDPALGTFFFNMEGSWLFGTEPGEIPDIRSLQAILTAIFSGAELPFNQEGLLQIAAEVEPNPLILTPAEAANLSKSVSAEYLEQNVRLANYFRGKPDAALLQTQEPNDQESAQSKPASGIFTKVMRMFGK